MILILTNILVMAVVNRVTSKLSAPIMKSRKKQISKVKEEEKPRRHI